MVYFESVHRIGACLADMIEAFGTQRHAFIGREITKMHEQCVSGELAELQRMTDDGRMPIKGEFVLIVEGQVATETSSLNIDLNQLLQNRPWCEFPEQDLEAFAGGLMTLQAKNLRSKTGRLASPQPTTPRLPHIRQAPVIHEYRVRGRRAAIDNPDR